MLSAEIVTADAQMVNASADENAELFWGLRGGGGGKFDIVTAITYRLHPLGFRQRSSQIAIPAPALLGA